MAQYLATSFNAEQQHAELIDSLTTFLIAEIGEVASGYAMLRVGLPPDRAETDESIELVRFYVCKEWHGRGVGKTLMQDLQPTVRNGSENPERPGEVVSDFRKVSKRS